MSITIVKISVTMVKEEGREEGKTLKDLIRAAGYGQKEFGETVGVGVTMLHYYSIGKKQPTLGVFLKMCAVLKQSPKSLASMLGFDVEDVPD